MNISMVLTLFIATSFLLMALGHYLQRTSLNNLEISTQGRCTWFDAPNIKLRLD